MSALHSENAVANGQNCLEPPAPSVPITGLSEFSKTIMATSMADLPAAAVVQVETAATVAAADGAATDEHVLNDITNNVGPEGSSPSTPNSSSAKKPNSVALDGETVCSPISEPLSPQHIGDKTSAVKEGGAADTDMRTDAESKRSIDIDAVPKTEEQSIKLVSYHHDADLYVNVRELEGTALYKVCSALVAAASPTWREKIENGKVFDSRSGKLVLDLDDFDDHAYGLDIVFSIIHYKFHEIPDRPDIDQLHSIAKVTEKYDCAHLLIPYMEKWVAGLNWHIVMKNEKNDNEKTMYLTWVFGEARWFARVLSKVAHKAILSDDGVLVDTRGQPWKDCGLPLVIFDLVTKTRNDCVSKIVKAINQPLQELMSGGKERTIKFCRAKGAHEDLKESCQLQQLGSLVSGLTTVGLLPFPAPEEYRGSVVDLAEKVWAVKVARFRIPGTPPHMDSHINCGINHNEALKRIMCKDAQLNGDIIRQLRIRAHKSGAFSEELFRDLKEVEERYPSSEPMEYLHLNTIHFKQVTDLSFNPSSEDEAKQGIKSEDLEA